MSIPVPAMDPFGLNDADTPTEQQRIRRAVEEATVAAVMPFENEKQNVNRDHNDMQRHLWGLRDDHMRPIELSTDGRKA